MHRRKPISIAVCLGRFQPLHLGHQALIGEALELADHVLIVIGSSYAACTTRNPFTWQQRQQ